MAEQVKLNMEISAEDKFTTSFRKLQTLIGKAEKKFSALGGSHIIKGFSRLSSNISNVQDKLGIFGKLGAVSGLAGGGIFALTKGVADAGMEISQLSQAAGVGVKTMQELSYAAKMNGLETEELAMQMATLGEWMVEANNGNEDMQKTFKAMGISVTDASGKLKKSDQVLMEMSDTFAQMEDGPTKSALAIKFFGDAGLKMLPMLSKGSKNIKELGHEANKLGLVMSNDSVNSSKAFSSGLVKLMEMAKGVGTTLGVALMPHLQKVVTSFQEWIGTNRELISQKIKEWVQAFGDKIPDIIVGIQSFFGGIANLCSWVAKLTNFLGGAQNVFIILAALMAGPLLLAIGSAIGAFITLGAAMLANPIGVIILSIGGLIAAFAIYKDNIFAFVSYLMKLWDKLCSFFTEKMAFIFDGIKVIAGWFKGLFGDEEKKVTVDIKPKNSFEGVEEFSPPKNSSTSSKQNPFANESSLGTAATDYAKNPFANESSLGAATTDYAKNPFANESGVPGTNKIFGDPLMNKNNSIPKSTQAASTQTKIERNEIKLILPEGVSAQGAENINGVTVDTNSLGMQTAWG